MMLKSDQDVQLPYDITCLFMNKIFSYKINLSTLLLFQNCFVIAIPIQNSHMLLLIFFLILCYLQIQKNYFLCTTLLPLTRIFLCYNILYWLVKLLILHWYIIFYLNFLKYTYNYVRTYFYIF